LADAVAFDQRYPGGETEPGEFTDHDRRIDQELLDRAPTGIEADTCDVPPDVPERLTLDPSVSPRGLGSGIRRLSTAALAATQRNRRFWIHDA
jgi:hypothetical protein